jgi:predicted NAD-dependent protein-ADP-ribosyltransferase YbiA (DUF1768 family)
MVVIKIFDPRDKPYGKLSNNYVHPMVITKKISIDKESTEEWNTVSNYIYSNLLRIPVYKNIVKNSKNKDIINNYNKLKFEEFLLKIKEAFKLSYNVKILEDENLQKILLKTGNKSILYKDEDKILGVGSNGNGLNIVGKTISHIRRDLKIKSKRKILKEITDKEEDSFYDTYIVYNYLTKRILYEDDNLEQYTNKTPEDILNIIGRDEIVNNSPSKNVIINLHKKDNIRIHDPEIYTIIKHPKSIVLYIRKKNIRKAKSNQEYRIKEIIFEQWVEYMLNKNYSDLETNFLELDIKDQINVKQILINKLKNIERVNDIYNFYNNDLLSKDLTSKISEIISDLHVFEEKDITMSEEEDLSIYEYEEEEEDDEIVSTDIVIDDMDENSVYISFDDYFSPYNKNKQLFIEGNIYPSIMYYVYHQRFTLLYNITKKESYKYLFINPKEIDYESDIRIGAFLNEKSIEKRYNTMFIENENQKKNQLAIIALDAKFGNRNLQDVLLMTENSKLIWGDMNDNYLGIGIGGRGKNHIGKLLSEKRYEIYQKRKNENIHLLDTSNIVEIIQKDVFMNEWIKMRLNDTCNIIIKMRNYIKNKDKRSDSDPVQITPEFVKIVLDKIYQPCSNIYNLSNKVTAKMPKYFSDMVDDCTTIKIRNNSKVEVNYSDKYYTGIIIKISNKTQSYDIQKENGEIDYNVSQKYVKLHTNIEIKFNENVKEIIWKRLCVLIYYLNIMTEKSNIKNIRAILGRVEYLTSNTGKCIDFSYKKTENCIISAILNIIKGIIEFNKYFSLNVKVVELDIKLACSIILNRKTAQIYSNDIKDVIESTEDDINEENIILINYLQKIPEIEDPVVIEKFIMVAVNKIFNYKGISNQIKKNRINFFATQKNN